MFVCDVTVYSQSLISVPLGYVLVLYMFCGTVKDQTDIDKQRYCVLHKQQYADFIRIIQIYCPLHHPVSTMLQYTVYSISNNPNVCAAYLFWICWFLRLFLHLVCLVGLNLNSFRSTLQNCIIWFQTVFFLVHQQQMYAAGAITAQKEKEPKWELLFTSFAVVIF